MVMAAAAAMTFDEVEVLILTVIHQVVKTVNRLPKRRFATADISQA